MDLVNKFAEIMNFDVPELANENAFRYEESKKSEMVKNSNNVRKLKR